MAASKPSTRSKAQKVLGTVVYTPDFPNGVLPVKRVIIENMIYLMRPQRAGQSQRSKNDAAFLLSEMLQDHWIFCNIYTIAVRHIKAKIIQLYNDFTNLVQTRKNRRNERYNNRVRDFNASAVKLFDIFCEDESKRKKLEELHDVKTTSVEYEFLEDQRTKRVMFCDDFVDKKWSKTVERKQKDKASLDKTREQSEADKSRLTEVGNLELSLSEEDSVNSGTDSLHCESESTEDDGPSTSKKRRRTLNYTQDSKQDDVMPHRYQHLRESVRKVRPEVYETIDKLKSAYHMSQTQAEGAVVTVGNKLFDRKLHNESDKMIDLDTLPQSSNTISRETFRSVGNR